MYFPLEALKQQAFAESTTQHSEERMLRWGFDTQRFNSECMLFHLRTALFSMPVHTFTGMHFTSKFRHS